MTLHDSDIVCIASGDRKAFGKLHKFMYDRLFFYAYKFLNDVEESEDLVQDVFIQFWENRYNFDNITTVKVYLYTLLHNKIRNLVRKKSRQNKIIKSFPVEETSNDEYIIMSAEIVTHVRQAINELPERTRMVMELGLLGMGIEDISKEMKISVNTVKTLKKNGYKVLRTSLVHLRSILPFILL